MHASGRLGEIQREPTRPFPAIPWGVPPGTAFTGLGLGPGVPPCPANPQKRVGGCREPPSRFDRTRLRRAPVKTAPNIEVVPSLGTSYPSA